MPATDTTLRSPCYGADTGEMKVQFLVAAPTGITLAVLARANARMSITPISDSWHVTTRQRQKKGR